MSHVEAAWETGPVLCHIAVWECLGVSFLLANTKLRGKMGQSSSPKTVPLCLSTQNKPTRARDLKLPIPCAKGRGKFGGRTRTWEARAIFFFGAVICEQVTGRVFNVIRISCSFSLLECCPLSRFRRLEIFSTLLIKMRMAILTPTKWLLDLTVGLEIWEYSTKTGKLNQSCIPWSSLQPFPGGLP